MRFRINFVPPHPPSPQKNVMEEEMGAYVAG
jgi:hypothetical protein